MSRENTGQPWEKLLNPETLRTNLTMVSLYLLAYELLKLCVVDRIKGFFTNAHSDIDPEYENVLKLHKSHFQASCLWLQQSGALDAQDLITIDLIRKHRNELAHELPLFLSDFSHNIDIDSFQNIRYLLRKISVWWFREVDILTSPELTNEILTDEDIHPGNVLVLDEIIRLAFENTTRQADDI